MQCVVDCRVDDKLDNDYLNLSLWGRPCFSHVIDVCVASGCFNRIAIISESQEIIDYCIKHYPNISVLSSDTSFKDLTFKITGRAPCISSKTIRDAIAKYKGGMLISSRTTSEVSFEDDNIISFYEGRKACKFNAFSISGGGLMDERKYYFYKVPDGEAVTINSANDFELALVLKKKQENRPIVIQTIDRIIKDKQELFSTPFVEKNVCLIGHSQLDQWNLSEIIGYKVRNCAVSGISSFEYNEKIIEKNMLNCETNAFIVMHGTNDIVWDYTIDEMVESIRKNIEYLRKNNPTAPIIFLSCVHVNGRLDRNNARIDELNKVLKASIDESVTWIDTTFMDNKYGRLDEVYTKDGLHFSDAGYELLKEKIEDTMRGIGL